MASRERRPALKSAFQFFECSGKGCAKLIKKKLVDRGFCIESSAALRGAGVHPVLSRVYAARGVKSIRQLDDNLELLLPFSGLKGISAAADYLAEAIKLSKKLLIIADYDADGATACAVGLRALRSMGADVDYLVPNRFEFGYGLTPEIVAVAAQRSPDTIITVDNGIASVDGVAMARKLGIDVVVTDHHLPGDRLPEANVIVNPNQPGCLFKSKCLAGVGTMFYVMIATRAALRERGAFAGIEEPNFKRLLDLVALGTVADVVPLDDNNRILVENGLKRVRSGRACHGINALFNVAGRDPTAATAWDFGFSVGPRINAAGRMTDISTGIELLICDDPERAAALAIELDRLNRERRSVESEMQESAVIMLEDIIPESRSGVCLHDASWHQGVVGIVASRIKEKVHRPTIAFASIGNGELKGSGRSIDGLHLRDALDLVSKRFPGLILKFGGHAMAAGVSIPEEAFDRFNDAFNSVCEELLDPASLDRVVLTDGDLENDDLNCELAITIKRQVWGQSFHAPIFRGEFVVESQRVVGEKHTKLSLSRNGRRFDAIFFFHDQPVPEHALIAYRLDHNVWNGTERVQLIIEHIAPSGADSGVAVEPTHKPAFSFEHYGLLDPQFLF